MDVRVWKALLDEAHKYLINSDSARLTQSISNLIRLQRHLATRVIIATQEPTVIPSTILNLVHVSTDNDSGSWYQKVMLLATGDALVFSPATAVAVDQNGGVLLLGREHFKLRVRPRLTLDGAVAGITLGRIRPLVADLSTTDTAVSTPARALETVESVSTPSALNVPARLKHLVGWLTRGGATNVPVKLADAKTALLWVGKKVYAGMKQADWWKSMMEEAVNAELVELINKDVHKKVLKARGEEEMIRLIHRGPISYV
ncbi:hypothetical protein B0H16DRAFT_1736988 [Mycena metata]|uniref:Uncharacterized protein n=1 Tax=Mycena metata TaxID=1033252 RepID=A0AAD7HNL4_9AGAR|nr:hypothetical protein B0H16DRAFT_1736988 [Mycena metata]